MFIIPYFLTLSTIFFSNGVKLGIPFCTVILIMDIVVVGMRRNFIVRSVKIYLINTLFLGILICNRLDIIVFIKRHIHSTTCHGFHRGFLCPINRLDKLNIAILDNRFELAAVRPSLFAHSAACAASAHYLISPCGSVVMSCIFGSAAFAVCSSPTIAARSKHREDKLENIKLTIAERKLVQEKSDEKQILYYLSNITKSNRSDIRYAQSLVDTFINSVYVYEDKVVICYIFTGDGSKIAIEDIKKAMLEA